MLRLNLNKKPEWLDLGHGVRFFVAPITSETVLSSQSDPSVKFLGEDVSDAQCALVAAKVLAKKTVLEWDGVGDEDGNPIKMSEEGLNALLDVWPIFEAFQAKCVAGAMLVDAEKNASAPLPNGSTTGETTIAAPAEPPAKTAPA